MLSDVIKSNQSIPRVMMTSPKAAGYKRSKEILQEIQMESKTTISSEDKILEFSSTCKNQVTKEIIKEILQLKRTQEIITKRDLFYKYKPILKTMSKTDYILNEICKETGLERRDLNIIATQKGMVSGNIIIITKDMKRLDATQSPILIPNKQSIKHILTKATKFLIVEKDAVFQALVDKGFSLQFPNCLLITGKGYPDVVTRELVVALSQIPIEIDEPDQAVPDGFWSDGSLSDQSFFSDGDDDDLWSNPLLALSLKTDHPQTHIQGFVLTDCDPHGYEIYKTFANGSATLKHLDKYLVCDSLIWVGIRPTMVDSGMWNLDLTGRERVKLVKMIKALKSGDVIRKELQRMLHNGYKCEIEVFGAAMLMDSIVL